MRILGVCLTTVVFLSPITAVAQGDTVERGPPPGWVKPSEPLPVPEDAAGLVFIRKQDTLVHLDDGGQWTYLGQRYKLLHPQALQLGNVSLVWNPAAGNPVVHHIRIHRDGQVIDVLDKAQFEILRREDQLEQAMLDGMLTAIFKVPDLRVGDELEFASTTPSQDVTLGAKSFGILFVGPTPPPGRVRLGLSWDRGQEPQIRLSPELETLATRSEGALDIKGDNLRPSVTTSEAPPRYSWQRIAEYSDFATWQDISARVAKMFDAPSRVVAGSPLESEIVRIAAAYPDPASRAEAALKLVQEQVRYIYVGLEGGNFTPASADATWERRYGDCKGKTALLLALLRGLGIEAEAVLANNNGSDDGLDERLPNPAMFDHVLVRAKIGSETKWLDGTFPGGYGPLDRPLIPYRWVLPLSEKGKALEKQVVEPPRLPLEMGLYEIDAREGFDQPAKVTWTRVARGVDGLVQHYQLSALTRDQLEAGMRNSLAGDSTWVRVDSVEYRFDRETLASVLTIKGLNNPGWEGEKGGKRSLVLPGGGFSPPSRKQRTDDQDEQAPYYSAPNFTCYATTLRLPDNTPLSNWGFNSVFDTKIYGRLYYRMMERNSDRTIRLVRGSRVEENEISAAKATRDNERLDDFDNSKANITFNPDKTMEPWGHLDPVLPSTDPAWLSDDPPCLPPDVDQ